MTIDNTSLPLDSTKDTSNFITSQIAPLCQSDNGYDSSWKVEQSWCDFCRRQTNFYRLQSVQTNSLAHSSTYVEGTGGKAAEA